MKKEHHYQTTITWPGNIGTGTSDYRMYERSHTLSIDGKPAILASSDTPFRGDASKHNPEDFFLASLSSCHMLWYLHLCADAGVVVLDYSDTAKGTMVQTDKGGHFSEVCLYPKVTVSDESMIQKAIELHHTANEYCFIANSVNFPIHHITEINSVQ
jgi:organic hydroperoxide reductase OsmC/OhrA